MGDPHHVSDESERSLAQDTHTTFQMKTRVATTGVRDGTDVDRSAFDPAQADRIAVLKY